MKWTKFAAAALCGLILTACDSPQSTVDSLRREIAAFRANPGDQEQLAIEQSFAKLESQIAKLEKSGKSAEAETFKQQAFELRSDYAAAKIARTVNDVKNAVQGFGNTIRDAGRSIEKAFRSPEPTPGSTPDDGSH